MGTLTTSFDKSFENDILRVFGYFNPTSIHIRNHEIYDHLRVATLSGPSIPNFSTVECMTLEASLNRTTNEQHETESITITYTWKKPLPFVGE